MMRATIIALVVLVWLDEITMNGQYTAAAIQMSRSVMHFAFRV